MKAIETTERDNYRLEIFQDEDPTSPDDWDNLGKIVHFDRYETRPDNLSGRELIEKYGNCVFAIITTRHGRESAWFITKPEWVKDGMNRERAQAYADGMADTWKQYSDGDVYGYRVSVKTNDPCACDAWEEKDSCWGFYGFEHCQEEGEGILKQFIAKEEEARAFESFGMAL